MSEIIALLTLFSLIGVESWPQSESSKRADSSSCEWGKSVSVYPLVDSISAEDSLEIFEIKLLGAEDFLDYQIRKSILVFHPFIQRFYLYKFSLLLLGNVFTYDLGNFICQLSIPEIFILLPSDLESTSQGLVGDLSSFPKAFYRYTIKAVD